MAKKKKEDEIDEQQESKIAQVNDEDCIYSASYILDNPPKILSISPKLDIALGGGVPEGVLMILTGPEKVGKSLTALHFAKNAQNALDDKGNKRKVFYANVEGRLKPRDLGGIKGLDLSPESFEVIGSTQGHILTGEQYLAVLDRKINTTPYMIGIIDSFSALSSQAEMVEDISAVQVAPMNKFLAKFTRRFCNVIPINKVTLVGITHLMANIQKFGQGKSKIEKSGGAIKYAQDVKLHATHKEPLMQGETQVGHKIHWTIENTALDAVPSRTIGYVKYGHGIWSEYEVVEICKDFGIIKGTTWLTLVDGQKVQGAVNAAKAFETDIELYEKHKKAISEIVGFQI